MIVLITGASHTGKTVLAQKLLEKYKYPYLGSTPQPQSHCPARVRGQKWEFKVQGFLQKVYQNPCT